MDVFDVEVKQLHISDIYKEDLVWISVSLPKFEAFVDVKESNF